MRPTKFVICFSILLLLVLSCLLSTHLEYFVFFKQFANMQEQQNSLTLTLVLLKSFVDNSLDYLKLFAVLFVVYKLCIWRNHSKQSEGVSPPRNLLSRLLHLFAFGIKDDSQLLATNDQEKLLPTTQTDLDKQETKHSTRPSKHVFSRGLCFMICFVGLQVSFLLWGLMQERILKFGYKQISLAANATESISRIKKFKNSQFLVLSNRYG